MALEADDAAVAAGPPLDALEVPPVCAVVCVDEETVARLKPHAQRLRGHGSIFRALADDQRLMICDALTHGELCVCDIAALLDATSAGASYHLRLLYNLGLVTYRRAGKLVYYSLAGEATADAVRGMVALALSEGVSSR